MNNATWKYFKLTLQHKWYVFLAGRKLGVSLWRLLTHDWTKLLPSNCYQYGKQFFGDKDDPLGFAITWCRHQNSHDHHWEYWIPRTGTYSYSDNTPLPMPEQAILEMIADWVGASKAYEGTWPDSKNWPWFELNYGKLQLHPDTRERITQLVHSGALSWQEAE